MAETNALPRAFEQVGVGWLPLAWKPDDTLPCQIIRGARRPFYKTDLFYTCEETGVSRSTPTDGRGSSYCWNVNV